MKARELAKLGFGSEELLDLALSAVRVAISAGMKKGQLHAALQALVQAPETYLKDPYFAELAKAVSQGQKVFQAGFTPRQGLAPYRVWGQDIEATALEQLYNALSLPVAVKGALMPDAHQGYGLPIGGVLATENSVIPYAVGVDIACRMKMTVIDLPVSALSKEEARLVKAIEQETRFGVGAAFKNRHQHAVMDEDWAFSSVLRQCKDKAHNQLGTSGSGNHFVEFGTLTLEKADLGLPAGEYLAILSHSGSRGTGAEVAAYYSKLAQRKTTGLPRQLVHLAWLGLDTHEGQEYWRVMELMGRYAAANHALMHRAIVKHLRAGVLYELENHHNFAWKEAHDGRELIVHRKGATPAGKGILGIIPGSMANPGYIVRGKGEPTSLNSASHGAGRAMSRKAALGKFTWPEVRRLLAERGVKLISAGLDEVPWAYKDIDVVMAAQADLVDKVARFMPRLVKMAPPGERAED